MNALLRLLVTISAAACLIGGAAIPAHGAQVEARQPAADHVGSASPREAAAPRDCRSFYPEGRAPRILRPKLQRDVRTLCYRSFGVLHSGASRAPLVSSTFLAPGSVTNAPERTGFENFYPEPRLRRSERAELADYRRQSYRFDRGHMTAFADAPDALSQAETFSLANIVPQAAGLNRGDWKNLEIAIRRTARRAPVYVATGPLYEGARLQVAGNVLVPTAIWKAVYVPGRGGQAWIATNEPTATWQAMTIAEVSVRAGIDPFPGLLPSEKAQAVRVIRFTLPATRRTSWRTPS